MKFAGILLLACLCIAASPLSATADQRLQLEIHPQGATVPENLLRIELRFSKTPRVPPELSQIRLMDGQDQAISHAFLDLLVPNADGRRFTLLLHPGRVKTGVGPNLESGRALREGHAVRLVVDHPELGRQAIRAWAVTRADDSAPQPTLWRIAPPPVHSRAALVVDLREPVSSTAEGMLAVRDADGKRVPGHTRLGERDSVWIFYPSRPWRAGAYALLAHPELEDPAGNRACAVFESTVLGPKNCGQGAVLPFRIGLPAAADRSAL